MHIKNKGTAVYNFELVSVSVAQSGERRSRAENWTVNLRGVRSTGGHFHFQIKDTSDSEVIFKGKQQSINDSWTGSLVQSSDFVMDTHPGLLPGNVMQLLVHSIVF